MSIFINVVNQKMRIHSPIDEFTSGSQEFVRFQFNLSADWDGLVTFAQFQQNGVAYNQYLDEDNGVYLPPEIKAGTCTLMLYGSRDTVIATTNYLTLRINKNNFISDAQSTEITESLYNQLVSKVDVFMSEAITHIDQSIETEMLDYLESGKLANLSIADGSITREKLSEDLLQFIDDESSGVSKEYVDNAIDALEDDVAYLSTHAATKQYVDDAIASGGGGTGGGSSEDVIDKIIDPDNNPLSVTEDLVLNIPIEVGGLSTSSGELSERDDAIRSADFIVVTPNETIQFASSLAVGGDEKIRVCCYGEDKTFIETVYPRLQTDFYIESDWHYIKFYRSDTGDSQVTMSVVRKGGVEKAEFKKIYFADHGYEIYGANIDDETMHKLVVYASGKDENTYNIIEVKAPSHNPEEATMCLMNWGNGAKQFVDFSSMVYDPENPTAEIVCQTRGGNKLPEFSIRYNDGQGAGRVKKFTVHPDAIPIELTAQGLKVRKNNTFDNNGTEEDYVIVNLAEAAESINDIAENYATKEYVDDAIASSGGVSKEYVDGILDLAENNESDIELIRQRTEALETDVETIKQGYVTLDYVNETYATKKYVDDAVASSGGGVSSWNDLTDKPFYDEGTKTATLDYANPPAVGIDFDGVFLGKVTDDILTADYINGAKLSLSFTTDGTVESISEVLNIDTLMVLPFPVGTVYQLNGENFFCMIVVATQTGEFDLFGDGGLITVPETGTYLSFTHFSSTTNSISLTYTLLKTLEAKYLEIINKTENVSILTEQEFSFTAAEDGTYQAMAGATPLTVGKTYKVVWDGAEYVYEAINMNGVIMIGDFLASNPFLIGLVEGSTMIATSNTSATHTVAITEVGGYEIKQEYLPASLYTEIDQRIEESIGDIETLLGGI